MFIEYIDNSRREFLDAFIKFATAIYGVDPEEYKRQINMVGSVMVPYAWMRDLIYDIREVNAGREIER